MVKRKDSSKKFGDQMQSLIKKHFIWRIYLNDIAIKDNLKIGELW